MTNLFENESNNSKSKGKKLLITDLLTPKTGKNGNSESETKKPREATVPEKNRIKRKVFQTLLELFGNNGKGIVFSLIEKADGVPIDKITTLDRDDAVYVEIEENNEGYRAKVTIADVGVLVKPGSKIEHEAQEKAFSRYNGKKGTQHMIPHEYSEGKLSLGGEYDTPTITFEIPVNKNGEVGEVIVKKTYFPANNKITYEEANNILKNPKSPDYAMLRNMQNLTARLESKKLGHNVRAGEVSSHNIVHEMMVLANQQVARMFRMNNIPGLFRNHKNNGNAEYSTNCEGHEGLEAKEYGHFTSPIRRYADYVNLVNLTCFMDGKPYTYSKEKLDQIAKHINEVEQEIKHGTRSRVNNIVPLNKNQEGLPKLQKV